MIPTKLRPPSTTVVFCLIAVSFAAPALASAGGGGFQTRHLAWVTLGSLFWSTLMLDWPAIRGLLQRSWLFSLVPALITGLMLPAFFFGLPFLGWLVGLDFGQRPGITSEGITLSVSNALQLFSPLFFMFCGTIAVCLALIKVLFLRAFASDTPRVAGIFVVMFMGFLSTMVFVGGVIFDQKRAIASVQGYVMGQVMGQQSIGKLPSGGDKAPGKSSGNPIQDLTAPLTDYYKNLNKAMPKR